MRNMRNLIILFFLLVGGSLFFNANATEADSLRSLINGLSKNDTTRLVHLNLLAVIKQSTREGLSIAQELYQDADYLNSDKYKSLSALYAALYYTNNSVMDSIEIYTNKSIQLAEKVELWKTYFEASKLKINLLIRNGELEYAVEEAKKMRQKATELNNIDGKATANINIAIAHIGYDRIKESIEILEAAYKDKAGIKNTFVLIELQSLLASTAHYMEDYDNLIVYLKDLNDTINDYLKNKPFSKSYNSIFIFIDIHYAYYYLAKENPKEALKYLEKIEKYRGQPSFIAHSDVFYDVYSEYHFSMNDYDQAITYADSSIVNLKVFTPKDYYKQLVKKAHILSHAGKYNEAIELYQESLLGKDSIDHVLAGKQMEQIQTIYKVNKLLLENERIKSNLSIILLIVLSLLIILISLLIIRMLFVRKKLKDSERETRKAYQVAEEANEVKNLFLSNMSYNIRTPLNSVVGFSQLIATDPQMDEEQRKEYSAIIKQNADILLNLVNDVLDISRLEAGVIKFSLQEYDIITLCKEAIYTAKEKGQSINIEFYPEFEKQKIMVDVSRFGQLLISLLTYPTAVDKELTIQLIVILEKENNCIRILAVNSPIANSEFVTQEVTIRNDINSLFLRNFGGTYKIYTGNTEDDPAIVFTYPLSISK